MPDTELVATEEADETVKQSSRVAPYHEPAQFNEGLAERIREYWGARGYEVRLTLRREQFGKVIRSDLVNGLPENYRGGRLRRRVQDSPDPAPETPRKRPCLRCTRPFLSEWRGNRLCTSCNEYARLAAPG